jgi:hypothetical protein
MTRRLLTLAVLAAAMCTVTSQQATAFGFLKKHHSSGPCPTDCAPGCSTSYSVSYVDKKVTAYQAETETKDVKVMVNEWVDNKEEYKYMVCEPVTTKTKVMVNEWVETKETYKYIICKPVTTKTKVTYSEQKTKEEPYKYTVMEPTQVKEKVNVCDMVPITKDVVTTVYDMVPVTTMQKRVVCQTVCVPVTVTCTVPVAPPHVHHGLFGGLCAKKHECECPTPCPPTPCYETITKTVMQRQVVSKEIEVPVTTCNRVPRQVTQKVTTYDRVWSTKEVMVTKCVPIEKTGMRTVCFYVPIEKEMDVTVMKPVEETGTRIVKKCVPIEKVMDVTTMVPVEKTGTRVVKKCVPVEKTVKQTFTKMVPYETVVKVPVYTPAPAAAPAPSPAPSATPCDACAPTHVESVGHRLGGGILHGCCHKCK